MFELTETCVPASSCQAFDRLLSRGAGRIFVLGCNKYASSVARVAEVEAFVDDFTNETTYSGRPIIRMSSLPSDGLVVSCVVDVRPLTALDRLRSCKVKTALDYFTLLRLGPDLFEPINYCGNNRADISANLSSCQWVYDRLADEESKDTFRKVVLFRYTFDLDFMRGFSLRIDRQYFEDFLPLEAGDVFVDGGGFDGQTTAQFAARNAAYRRIHYFEPTPAMMEISRRNLNGLRDVCLVQKGLYSREGEVWFDADSGSASKISDCGATEIQLTTLDKEVSEPVSLIKLDIEGAEFQAINGAVNHIQRHTPRMAVCVYHNQSDFWRIPRRILELNDRYKIYLRHYSEGILETVMFFIPQRVKAKTKPLRNL